MSDAWTWAAWEETLELLSDPQALAEIAEAREAVARGEGLDAEALRARYLRGRPRSSQHSHLGWPAPSGVTDPSQLSHNDAGG